MIWGFTWTVFISFSKILHVFSNHFLHCTTNILNLFTMYGCKTPQLADQASFGTHTCLGPAMKSMLECNKDFWIQNAFIFCIDAFLSLIELWAELVLDFLSALLNASMFSWSFLIFGFLIKVNDSYTRKIIGTWRRLFLTHNDSFQTSMTCPSTVHHLIYQLIFA